MTIAQVRAARRRRMNDPRWSKLRGRKSAAANARKRLAFIEGRKK